MMRWEIRQLLKELQGMVEKTDKKDDFQKEFEKEIYAEEKRLLGLLDELERERYVVPCNPFHIREMQNPILRIGRLKGRHSITNFRLS